jgi:hypothetical protein
LNKKKDVQAKIISINDYKFLIRRIYPKHGYLSYEITTLNNNKDHFYMIRTDYSNFRIIQKSKIDEEIIRIETELSLALNNIDSDKTEYQTE